MSLPVLMLKKNEDRRLRAGHLWVFSNEVDVKHTPLTGFEAGELVQVQAAGGKPMGLAYVNPHSLITARLLTHGKALPKIGQVIRKHLAEALALRERLFDQPYYRLVFGESDGLPGLVVDRFGDYLVVQITTAGMEAQKAKIIDNLAALLSPKGMLLQNDLPMRTLEQLPTTESEIIGEFPDQLCVIENGIEYQLDSAGGQKTGWFYDQRDNRAKLARYVKGQRVLDVFSYAGGWGVSAARAGAASVVCVDSSKSALAMVEQNARLNDVAIETRAGDAFHVLQAMREAGEKFDVVIVDPPAFIKRRKDHKAGMAGYQRINQAALQVLESGGVLVSCSCSQMLGEHELSRIIQRAARHVDRRAQILEWCHQAADHPEHPAIPETRYLKGFYVRILAGD